MKPQKFRSSLSARELLAIDPRALDVMFDAPATKETECIGSVAIVSICGPLEHHHSQFWDSYDDIYERMEAAFCDPDVTSVVMCIDSPGGDASGTIEIHNNIQRLKKTHKKPLYAYSNEAMYSAAYAIGSAADEIWVPTTGGVGSVGVICALMDNTKANEKAGVEIKLITTGARKADSWADRKLTDDIVSVMQQRVDYLGDEFFRIVSQSRKVKPKAIKALEAGTYLGQSAIDSNLADKVGGWYEFMDYLVSQSGGRENAGDKQVKTSAQLTKEKAALAKQIAECKSATERTKLMSSYEVAVSALADIEAKTKYVKKTEEKYEEDDQEDEESEEETEAKGDDDDDDDGDDDDDDGDADEKSKKMAASALSLKHVEKLFSLTQSLTGKSDVSEVMGALEGMAPRVKAMPKSDERIAKLEQDAKRTKVRGMLDKAKREGRVTPAQAKALESKGIEDPRWLRGYLSVQPKSVRTVEEGGIEPNLSAATPRSIDFQGLSEDHKKILTQSSQSAGMSVEDFAKNINERRANGASPKF